jgi:hypothetical protein
MRARRAGPEPPSDQTRYTWSENGAGRLVGTQRAFASIHLGTSTTRRGNYMWIAQVAPPFESVPPARYGGTERVIATLTTELVCQVNRYLAHPASGQPIQALRRRRAFWSQGGISR